MKKTLTIILTLFCVGMLFICLKIAVDSGMMRRYPKAEHFSAEEAEKRTGYNQLSDKEKAVYTAIYRGVCDHKEKIMLPYEVAGDTYSKIYCMLEKQEGRLFYIDSTYYTAEKVREAHILYREDEENSERMAAELDAAVSSALRGITLAAGEYEAAMKVHDFIVRTCKYDVSETNAMSSTAYGCLVEKKANCEGYAKAFELLMSELGMECAVVTGITDKGENHAWNQAKIDGEWYNVDVTWDDTDVAGDIRRKYFLCDDKVFYETHKPDTDVFAPNVCENSEGSYYNKSGLYAESEDAAAEILRREVRKGNKRIEMRFADKHLYDTFKRRYIDDQEIFGIIMESSWGSNTSVSVSFQEDEKELCVTIFLS